MNTDNIISLSRGSIVSLSAIFVGEVLRQKLFFMGVIISSVENTSYFVISQNLFLISKNHLICDIENQICDIKKSGLFCDIKNSALFCDIKKSIL